MKSFFTLLQKEAKNVEVCYQDEKFWLTQKQLAELFSIEFNSANLIKAAYTSNRGGFLYKQQAFYVSSKLLIYGNR
jgi:hypothetical protein